MNSLLGFFVGIWTAIASALGFAQPASVPVQADAGFQAQTATQKTMSPQGIVNQYGTPTQQAITQTTQDEASAINQKTAQAQANAQNNVVTSCPTLTHDFGLGDTDVSTNGEVSLLQRFLIEHHYNGELGVTGMFDAGATKTNLINFQKANGLEGLGVVGPKTRAMIVSICSNVSDTETISVPGMSTYIDSDFGFSFWYPSGWTVTAVPASSHQTYAYPGGTVTNQLTVRSNVNPNDVIVIEEFTSPTRTITIPGGDGGCPGGICPLTVRYYFDADAHTWMQQYPDGSGANPHYIAPGTTQAADVSVNNMGGLHMFYTGSGTATIVPLSARNFLVVTAHGVVGVPQDPLVKTILATDPAVATPVSAAEQVNMIQAEKDAYVR